MLIVVVVVVDVVVVVVVVGKLIFWLQEFQGSALILPGCFAYGDEIRGSCCSCFALPYNFPNWLRGRLAERKSSVSSSQIGAEHDPQPSFSPRFYRGNSRLGREQPTTPGRKINRLKFGNYCTNLRLVWILGIPIFGAVSELSPGIQLPNKGMIFWGVFSLDNYEIKGETRD